MSHRLMVTAATFLLLSLFDLPPAYATWSLDGTAISSIAGSHQMYTQVASDGAGGAIIAWWDIRGPSPHIYLQRIDSFGNPLWATDGISICPSSTYQYNNFAVISDDEGGAIVAWEDGRAGYDVYAQRVNPDGNLLWDAAGVLLCNGSGYQRLPQAVRDGSGGAYVAWQDDRTVNNKDIYAQHLDANGTLLWTAGALAVCTAAADQESPEIAADVLGAYIIWKDMRAGNYDIYAARVNADGTLPWAANGSVVCTATGTQDQAQVISNGFGGLLAVWHDLRVATGDIYFQLLNSAGSYQLTVNGVVVSTTSGDKTNPQIVSDGATAGAIIAWQGYSGGWNIYAQRMKSGVPTWGAGGVTVCSVAYNEEQLQLIPDGGGGMIAAWADSRLGWEYNIFAQRLDANGAAQWTANGVALCEALNGQYAPQLVSDGARGAIVAWQDYRSFTNYDVYAQRVDQNGYWGYPSADIHSVRDVPGDQGGQVNVAWQASRLDPLPNGSITKYTVWRAMPTAQAQLAIQRGASMLASVADLDLATMPAGPVLREQELAGVTYFWEMVASVDAYYLDAYAKVVPTLFDSTATVDDPQYFQVIAHTANAKVFWISAPASGRSIDNLAPAAPAGLAGAQVFTPAGLRLIWNANHEADLSHYAVYRGNSANFVPGVSNLVAELPDTVLTDSGWCHCGTDYYKVAALDIHGNVSVFALLTPQAVTDVGTPKLPASTYLAQNVPNPFNPSTRISFGLKTAGNVSLRIYDPAGRLVRVLLTGTRPAGVYETNWDGRDNAGHAVASGVYFYRLQAGTFSQTRRMVLLK